MSDFSQIPDINYIGNLSWKSAKIIKWRGFQLPPPLSPSSNRIFEWNKFLTCLVRLVAIDMLFRVSWEVRNLSKKKVRKGKLKRKVMKLEFHLNSTENRNLNRTLSGSVSVWHAVTEASGEVRLQRNLQGPWLLQSVSPMLQTTEL